ncbi:MAG: hypothetical protein ACHREM_14565 [Polyangiales bacterium]
MIDTDRVRRARRWMLAALALQAVTLYVDARLAFSGAPLGPIVVSSVAAGVLSSIAIALWRVARGR